MKVFCIDIGNTRTHCALVDDKKVISSQDYNTEKFVEEFDFSGIREGISWCSVVPSISEKLRKRLKDGKNRNIQLTYENSPIEIDIKSPKELGQDRIADAVGASIFFEPPYIVVDMGTAVTIDVVDKKGRYAGGAIAPGLHAFTGYLSEKTAQLPLINPAEANYDLTVGKDTVEAMYVGCVKGFCMLIDGIISDIEKEYFGNRSASKKTIFTGGSLDLLPKKWLAHRKLESNLANMGLAVSYEFNSKKK